MNVSKLSLPRRALALAAVAAVGLAACGSDDSTTEAGADTSGTAAAEQAADAVGISMTDAWSRQPADGQTTGAVYGTLTNGTDETITAISASSSATDTVELHEVLVNDEDQMTMQEKEGGYEIAAGETLTFEPGGAHIMLLGIDPATYPDPIEMTLTFDNGATLDFTAEVRALDGAEETHDMDDGTEMDDSEMDDSEMDHSDMDDSSSTDG